MTCYSRTFLGFCGLPPHCSGRLLPYGAATIVLSPVILGESWQAGEDCQDILSWLPGSQHHSPASHHPWNGGLSGRLCKPSALWKFMPSASPSLHLPISWICSLFQEVGTGSKPTSTIILENFKAHADNTHRACARTHTLPTPSPQSINQSPGTSLARLSGTHPCSYILDFAITWSCSASNYL